MTPGHVDEKVAGNGNHYKTSAEVRTNLRQRPFFLSTSDFEREFAKFRTNLRRRHFF